ncbi:MAG: hypothetical protein JJ896_03995 [Rhodothermales bacterium]|nr:hypothetical protein [Rhodothermales bacterium]MBO6778798.1 hypothetical protein [Rhodothermales bacterium]
MRFQRTHRKSLGRLDDLIARLPFSLDDGDAVGDVYEEWRQKPSAGLQHLVDLWTYCYVRRYFLMKFMRSSVRHSSGDLDMVVERAFRKIEQGREAILDGRRYPRWVIVVCRNTFLNFVGRYPDHISVDRIAEPSGETDVDQVLDHAMRATALDVAIARLPTYLRIPVRLRVVQELSYEVISERLGMGIASVRTYVHRGLQRLRQDRALREALGYETRAHVSKGS